MCFYYILLNECTVLYVFILLWFVTSDNCDDAVKKTTPGTGYVCLFLKPRKSRTSKLVVGIRSDTQGQNAAPLPLFSLLVLHSLDSRVKPEKC